MSTELYYFSATGNSLVAARDLAEKTGGELKSIVTELDNDTVATEADVIGIVFPAYYTQMPHVVERFIKTLPDLRTKYVFTVVTVGGIAGNILNRVSDMIAEKGGVLSGGFIVRMPGNYIHSGNAVPPFLQRRMFRKWEKKADEITDYVLNERYGLIETFNPVMTTLFQKSLEKKAAMGALAPDIDRHFYADDRCKGCGTCARVCPVGNIKMIDGKPCWQHQCEKCLACIQWCPQTAIQYDDVTQKRKRYHHPDVTLADIVKQNGREIVTSGGGKKK